MDYIIVSYVRRAVGVAVYQGFLWIGPVLLSRSWIVKDAERECLDTECARS